MTLKKLLLTILLSELTAFCFGQTTYVLNLKKKNYFSEKNQFYFDSSLKVIQEVSYDRPNVVDENYSLILSINIKDISKATLKNNLDLTKDTNLITCHFDILSVWNWEEEKTSINGSINIVSYTTAKIEVKFNIVVIELRNNRTYIYKGTKTFKNKPVLKET